MARITGIGGVFVRAQDPEALQAWYVEHLGLPVDADGYAVMRADGGETITWAAFPADTDYFGPRGSQSMINYRVDDLDALLSSLRERGVEVDERIEEHEYGRFGWASDPEGNRFELWEPGPGH